MAITEDEIDRFHRFMTENRTTADNVVALAHDWATRQQQAEDMAAIKSGIAQADAGELRPLEEVDRELREKHGIPQAK